MAAGAGKTTMLDLVAGRKNSGHIEVGSQARVNTFSHDVAKSFNSLASNAPPRIHLPGENSFTVTATELEHCSTVAIKATSAHQVVKRLRNRASECRVPL